MQERITDFVNKLKGRSTFEKPTPEIQGQILMAHLGLLNTINNSGRFPRKYLFDFDRYIECGVEIDGEVRQIKVNGGATEIQEGNTMVEVHYSPTHFYRSEAIGDDIYFSHLRKERVGEKYQPRSIAEKLKQEDIDTFLKIAESVRNPHQHAGSNRRNLRLLPEI